MVIPVLPVLLYKVNSTYLLLKVSYPLLCLADIHWEVFFPSGTSSSFFKADLFIIWDQALHYCAISRPNDGGEVRCRHTVMCEQKVLQTAQDRAQADIYLIRGQNALKIVAKASVHLRVCSRTWGKKRQFCWSYIVLLSTVFYRTLLLGIRIQFPLCNLQPAALTSSSSF